MLEKYAYPWIPLLMVLTIGLVGCGGGLEPPVSPQLESATSLPATPLPTVTHTPVLNTSEASLAATATPSPPPLGTQPTTQPGGFHPPPIDPQNASSLTQVALIDLGPWDLVHALAWSPNGDRLGVTAGEWLHIYPFPGPGEPTSLDLGVWSPGLAFSPDGRWIATGGRDGVIRLWQASSLTSVREIEAHKKGLNQILFSPAGDLLASGGNDAMARVWDSRTGEQQIEMIGGTFSIPAIEFSQGGEALAILNGGLVRVRDIESGRFVRTLSGEGSYFSLAIAPGDQILALGGADNLVEIWEWDSEAPIYRLEGHTGATGSYSSLIWDMDFNPQGSLLASAGGDATIRLWEAGTGKLLVTLRGHNKAVSSLAFSPDGTTLAAGALDGTVSLWGVSP